MKHIGSLLGGFRNWPCHVSGKASVVVPTAYGDATCSHCGSLLWPRRPRDRRTVLCRQNLKAAGAKFSIDFNCRAWKVDLSDSNATDQLLTDIGLLAPITELNLTDCEITDSGIQHLSGLASLEVLDLTNTRISDYSLRTISSFHVSKC